MQNLTNQPTTAAQADLVFNYYRNGKTISIEANTEAGATWCYETLGTDDYGMNNYRDDQAFECGLGDGQEWLEMAKAEGITVKVEDQRIQERPKHKCPRCGNTLFDQGLSTLYCGACYGTYRRSDLR